MTDFKENDKVSFVPRKHEPASANRRSVGYILFVEPDKHRAKVILRDKWDRKDAGNRPRFYKDLDDLTLEPPDEDTGTTQSGGRKESGGTFRVRPQ